MTGFVIPEGKYQSLVRSLAGAGQAALSLFLKVLIFDS